MTRGNHVTSGPLEMFGRKSWLRGLVSASVALSLLGVFAAASEAQGCSNVINRGGGWTTILFPDGFKSGDRLYGAKPPSTLPAGRFAVDPLVPDRILLWNSGEYDQASDETANPRMFLTVDGGCTWTKVTDAWSVAKAGERAVLTREIKSAVIFSPDPTGPPRIVAAITAPGFASLPGQIVGSFLAMSKDGGKTWGVAEEIEDGRSPMLVASAANPKLVVATSRVSNRSTPSALISTDAGESWTSKRSDLLGRVSDHAASPTDYPIPTKTYPRLDSGDQSVILAGTNSNHYSQDAGDTWQEGEGFFHDAHTDPRGNLNILGSVSGGCRDIQGEQALHCIGLSSDGGASFSRFVAIRGAVGSTNGGDDWWSSGAHFGSTQRFAVACTYDNEDDAHHLLRIDFNRKTVVEVTPGYDNTGFCYMNQVSIAEPRAVYTAIGASSLERYSARRF